MAPTRSTSHRPIQHGQRPMTVGAGLFRRLYGRVYACHASSSISWKCVNQTEDANYPFVTTSCA